MWGAGDRAHKSGPHRCDFPNSAPKSYSSETLQRTCVAAAKASDAKPYAEKLRKLRIKLATEW